jgi:sigma-B regulation protein RsbU (phosphoserine phosphatase)
VNPVAPIPRDAVQLALRSELPFVALAAIVVVVGLAAVMLWRLRSRDPLLLWLGILSLLYGLRLFAANGLVRVALGLGKDTQRQMVDIITFSIGIPFLLSFREWFGARWRRVNTALLWAQIAFAPLAIAVGVIGSRRELAMAVNDALLLPVGIVFLLAVRWFRREPGVVVLKYMGGFFMITAVLTNLRLTGGHEIEPLGFLALLFGLTYTAARRAVDREEKLISVEQELETARRIQMAILPKQLPDLKGLGIAARYQPMTAVAGDFYDFLQIDDRRVTILVADVSGHGVPAALIASMLKPGKPTAPAILPKSWRD